MNVQRTAAEIVKSCADVIDTDAGRFSGWIEARTVVNDLYDIMPSVTAGNDPDLSVLSMTDPVNQRIFKQQLDRQRRYAEVFFLNIIICLLLCVSIIFALVLTGCNNNVNPADSTESATEAVTEAPAADGIDYMALVNKTHALPDTWEDKLETVHMTNSVGDDVEVEKKAYDAYLKLKEALEAEDIHVDLDSARRSVEAQQRIMDDFTEKYGADYAAKTVAKPGYSEHHTGLALDLYLIIDGKDVVLNEEMIQYPEIWAKIHEKLADYGFILRYLDGEEHITGYGYEPWHIRYIDNVDIAKEITSKGITFEEYLGAYTGGEVSIDYGTSDIYTEDELKDAVIQIKCKFAFWGDVDLKSIKYAGDEAVTDENLKWMNEINPDANYTQVVEFLMDFHTPEDVGENTFNADFDYTDYQWWLARTDDGGWEVVTFGY